MSSSESDEEPERVEHVRAELSKKKSFFDYFSTSQGNGIKSNEPTVKKRKLQRDDHYCIKCNKLLSRGNFSTKHRHANSCHKNDKNYDIGKHILRSDHHLVVAAQKQHEKKGRLSHVTTEKEISKKANECEKMSEPVKKTAQERSKNTCSTVLQNIASAISSSDSELSDQIDETIATVEKRKISDVPLIQSTLNIAATTEKDDPNEEIREIQAKLDILIARMQISPDTAKAEENLIETTESGSTLKAMQDATCLLEIDGTGVKYYANNLDGGILRCEVCFDHLCQNQPSLRKIDPCRTDTSVAHREVNAGNTFSTGIALNKDKVEALMLGHNQTWHNYKRMMLDHVGCSTTRNGGLSHYRALVAQKQRSKIYEKLKLVMSNQLHAALTVVKTKTASLHYENMIGLLASCGSEVGNLGHGKKQMKAMVTAFYAYILKKTREMLLTPLPSTGIPPHFSTTSDKSTPAHISNHAIMIMVTLNGKKIAIPVDAPPVYHFEQEHLEGGTASELAEQVLASLSNTLKLPNSSLSHLVAHHADGQYQAAKFQHTLRDAIHKVKEPGFIDKQNNGASKFFVLPWDTAHYLDCAMTEVREKEEAGKCLRVLIKRTNKFQSMFGRGRGYAEYKGYAKEHNLKANVAKTFSTTRFFSSAFNQFTSVYDSYEALAKAFTAMRETEDECEEMRYLVKGRDFCIDLCGIIDILSPIMEMMVKSQSLDQYLWSITVWWPRVKNMLTEMQKNIAMQLVDIKKPVLNSQLFPKLHKHYVALTVEEIEDCMFKNVQLNHGWLVEDQGQVVDEKCDDKDTKKKTKKKMQKLVTWHYREAGECLQEMEKLCSVITEKIDQRYISNTPEAAHTLRCFHIPDILKIFENSGGQITASMRVKIENHGKDEFEEFFSYICELPHIKALAAENEELSLHPDLSSIVMSSFKHTVYKVVWDDFAGCRQSWFQPVKGKHLSERPTNFTISQEMHKLEDLYQFEYKDHVCLSRFSETTAFASFYNNELIYSAVKKELCIALDIALAMSGTEAVVESYYSVMGSQTMSGGQLNDTLVQRTVVDWCFPMPLQCQETIKEVAALYIKGDQDAGLKPHQLPVFLDHKGRAIKKYSHGSKVLDRLSVKPDNFVLCEKDKLH